jgi:hypothetical protein
MPKTGQWRLVFLGQHGYGDRWLKMEEKGVKWGIKQNGGSAQ